MNKDRKKMTAEERRREAVSSVVGVYNEQVYDTQDSDEKPKANEKKNVAKKNPVGRPVTRKRPYRKVTFDIYEDVNDLVVELSNWMPCNKRETFNALLMLGLKQVGVENTEEISVNPGKVFEKLKKGMSE